MPRDSVSRLTAALGARFSGVTYLLSGLSELRDTAPCAKFSAAISPHNNRGAKTLRQRCEGGTKNGP